MRKPNEPSFHIAIFLDDDSIVEEDVVASDGDAAASLLLSAEAGRRGTPYTHLRERVLPGGVLGRRAAPKHSDASEQLALTF